MADQPPSVVHGEIIAARDNLMLPEAEQLELIRDELPDRCASTAVRVYRGRGRPPGATNVQNRKFRDFVLSQHSHPGLALARIYDRPTELLAAELGCKMIEAAQLQARAAIELLPYMEGKAPIAVDIRRRNDVVMIMPGAGVTDEEIEAMRGRIGDELGEIDWSLATAADVLAITSEASGQGSDVQPDGAA